MRTADPGRRIAARAAFVLLALAVPASGALLAGSGGSSAFDCIVAIDVPGANSPAPPRLPKRVDCVDGDPVCDADGERNAHCRFTVRLCTNSTAFAARCTPERADEIVVAHAVDDGDRRFDPDFQAIQSRANLLGLPDDTTLDHCTLLSSINMDLIPPPSGSGPFTLSKKHLRLRSEGRASNRPAIDRDRVDFTCRPEGNGLYDPRDLYTGTFDRIAREILAPRCAASGCHDSESHQANQILLPNAAYSQIVGVTPETLAAAADGLQRVFPGDPERSFIYRKITGDLAPGYGDVMPRMGPLLSAEQIELIRLWIVGDVDLGPAPQTGWVPGTDG